jgi:hypothetical protein
MLPPNVKNARIPHTAQAKLMPPRTQFHLCFTMENWRRQAIQTSEPKAMATITNPYPNNASTRSHNTYSNTTITTIEMSLRPTGEAMKLRNRFHTGWLFLAFCPDLDPLLDLDTD